MCPCAKCQRWRRSASPNIHGIHPLGAEKGVVSMIRSPSPRMEGGTLSPLFNQVCGPRLRHRHRRPSPPRPEREREKEEEGKENLSLSPHKNFPAFLSLSLRRLSERASERARGGKWKVRDGDEWERATMRERERERRGRGRLTLNSSVHRSCTRPPARAH